MTLLIIDPTLITQVDETVDRLAFNCDVSVASMQIRLNFLSVNFVGNVTSVQLPIDSNRLNCGHLN